jgi:phage-related protein
MKETWSIFFVNPSAEDEVKALSSDLQAKFLHISELLQEFGPQKVGLPHIRPLSKGLWEIRMKGRDNIARSIYVLAQKKKIVILHTFAKKTQKTPERAIQMATRRLKELNNAELD